MSRDFSVRSITHRPARRVPEGPRVRSITHSVRRAANLLLRAELRAKPRPLFIDLHIEGVAHKTVLAQSTPPNTPGAPRAVVPPGQTTPPDAVFPVEPLPDGGSW